jgi:undecaprenyl-diphosphatase
MDFWHILALAILQGLTEFLPISSSAHLILLPRLLGWSDQGLAFDVAVHIGTLTAVIVYFRNELSVMARDWGPSLLGQPSTTESRLVWAVLLGTVPAGLAGFLLNGIIETSLRSPIVIAFAIIGFGLLLWLSDAFGRRVRDEHNLTWKDVLVVGFAQALSLIPGTSRSGITMTAGLSMGLSRRGAARFSFLLAIPLILLAGSFQMVELVRQTDTVDWNALFTGTVASAISAYVCIEFFLKLIERIGMFPFVLYRLFMGVVLLVMFI